MAVESQSLPGYLLVMFFILGYGDAESCPTLTFLFASVFGPPSPWSIDPSGVAEWGSMRGVYRSS